ncbi:MAG: hypothetical protein CL676_03225 [Bdellovibrionaceae bacterium]|nr:hypothetical protein [Pseudobdellovibrionaceae bacterium]|tara:strand:- start:11366 stop:12487 length:1122 start_codon:yes stop_codon:yes gene_type:complete
MKLSLILLLGFAMSQAAFATRARLMGLGLDKNGSLFVEDDRNVFLNPAHINAVENKVNLEAGATDRISGTTTNDPKAEGGVSYKMDPFSLGVQIGRVSKAADRMDTQNALTSSFYDPQNSLEVIVGGGDELKWGGSLHYANSTSDVGTTADYPDSKAQVVSARGGVATDRFQVYGAWDIKHTSETATSSVATQKYDGNLSLEVGGSFNLAENSKVGGYVLMTGYDFDNGGATRGENKHLEAQGSYFHVLKKSEGATVFALAGLYYQKDESKYTGAGDDTYKYLLLPTGVGVEVQLSSWFVARGSVAQNLILDTVERTNGSGDYTKKGEDDTVVTLGSSFIFKDFALDATLEGSSTGKINGNTLIANVGATYSF